MPPMASPSQAAYGMDRYGAIVALKLMISARIRPANRPNTIGTVTSAGLPLAMYCDHGYSAVPISTSSSRKDLLMVPCSVIASPTAARGRPAKVFSFSPGLPVRIGKFLSAINSSSARRRRLVLVVLDQRIGRVIVNGFEILALHHVGGDARFIVQPHRDIAHHVF